MAAGIAAILIGLGTTIQSASLLVQYVFQILRSGGFEMFEGLTAEAKVDTLRGWTPYLLEPLVGVCIIVLGVWLFRSRSAVRLVLGIKRRRT